MVMGIRVNEFSDNAQRYVRPRMTVKSSVTPQTDELRRPRFQAHYKADPRVGAGFLRAKRPVNAYRNRRVKADPWLASLRARA